eukprot:scaffold2710_cov72-Cylindrotheca_fusiformis.AAC.3
MLGPGNQYRTRDASALAVFLADLEPTKRIERHTATFLKGIATTMLSNVQPMPVVEPVQAWGYKNVSLLAQTFVYAAESNNLATCIMEGYDSRRIQEILQIPDRYAIPLTVAVGYEYEDEKDFERTPRLDISETVFADTFGKPLLIVDSNDGDDDDDDDDDDAKVV